MIAVLHYKKRSPPAQQTRCWWWCSIFEEVLTKMMTDVTDVWAPLGCNNSKFSQIMCIICFIFHITQVKFLKLFLTLHTPVSSKKGKVFLVSHSDKVISELFGHQSRLLWYRWLCVRAHDVGLGSLNAVNSVSVLFCANHFDSSVPWWKVHVPSAGNRDPSFSQLPHVVELAYDVLQLIGSDRKVPGFGPDVSVVSADDCILDGLGGQKLVVNVWLPVMLICWGGKPEKMG